MVLVIAVACSDRGSGPTDRSFLRFQPVSGQTRGPDCRPPVVPAREAAGGCYLLFNSAVDGNDLASVRVVNEPASKT